VSYKKQELLSIREHLSSPLVFGGGPCSTFCSVYCVVLLCVFTFWVPCCDVPHDSAWNNLHNEKIGKPNNLKVFRRKRTKEPKQNSQSRLRSHMTEGMREENLNFINNYIIPGLWITTHVTLFDTIFCYIVLVSFIVNGNRIEITDLSEVTDIIHGIEIGNNLSDHISLLCNGFILLVMVSLLFCPFSISRCIVCSSATYRVWLPLWYLQVFLSVCIH
jgi:hypothetical protein